MLINNYWNEFFGNIFRCHSFLLYKNKTDGMYGFIAKIRMGIADKMKTLEQHSKVKFEVSYDLLGTKKSNCAYWMTSNWFFILLAPDGQITWPIVCSSSGWDERPWHEHLWTGQGSGGPVACLTAWHGGSQDTENRSAPCALFVDAVNNVQSQHRWSNK